MGEVLTLNKPIKGRKLTALKITRVNKRHPHAKNLIIDLLPSANRHPTNAINLADEVADGAIGGDVSYAPTPWGWAYSFDGSGSTDRITFTGVDMAGGAGRLLAMSAWVIPRGSASGHDAVWSSNSAWRMYRHSGNNWQAYTGSFRDSGVAAVPGKLTHILVLQDDFGVANNVKVFVDGLLGYDGTGHTAMTDTTLYVGGDAFNQMFTGEILNFRAWRPEDVLFSNEMAVNNYMHPFEMYETVSRVYMPAAAAAPSGNVPIMHHHYNTARNA